MVHGCHVIWGTYGFWLPNDPRGSWSDVVDSWDLARFGKATRHARSGDRHEWQAWRDRVAMALKFPAVRFSGVQAHSVGTGFANAVRKCKFTVWACSILPEHVHLVIARHVYPVERVCIQLKGEATKQLRAESRHPLSEFEKNGKLPSLWGEKQWKVFLDNNEAIQNAVRYVEENPVKEGKPRQRWSFVTPFSGVAQ